MKIKILTLALLIIAGATQAQWNYDNQSLIYSNGGNVGIGLSNPATKLHVIGEGSFGNNGFGTLRIGNDDGTYLWIKNHTNDRTLRLNADNSTFDMTSSGNFEWFSGGTSRMYIGSGTLTSNLADNILLTRFSASAGSGGNTYKNNIWLYRDTQGGNNWISARLHDGISIDGSYVTPGTDTRTWWERDPYDDVQSFGQEALIT